MASSGQGTRSIRPGFAALVFALSLACSRKEGGVEPLRLEWIRPRSAEGVFLNEDLAFTFSAEVDPLSVIRRGIQVHDADGLPARGSWFIEGEQVRFAPAEVLARDLSDGGYRPGTRYQVEILGFPRVDAVRGLDGRPLERSYRWSFATVSIGSDHSGLVFEDASPASAATIRPVERLPWIGPDGPFLLECDEPIDPSSIVASDFLFVRDPDARESAAAQDPARGEPPGIEVRAVLVQNLDEADRAPGKPCAVIELYPSPGPLAPGGYSLRLARPLSLRDFGGNPVAGPWRSDQGFRVIAPGAEGERTQLHLAFLESRWSSPFELPGMDGTAHWSETGRLEIQFPLAAGEGTDGNVVLGERETRRDVQATRLALPEGTRCVLEGPGLRVLRAQGKVTLSGELVRRSLVPGETSVPPEKQGVTVATRVDLTNNLLRAASPLLGRGLVQALGATAPARPLSTWLAEELEKDPSWTIVIAGGDLVIDGSVHVDTPLLLVAGGLIRTYGDGTVRAAESKLMLLGGGGGWNLDPNHTTADLLFLDAPVVNPLRVPLRYGILSQPLPASARVTRWRNATADGWPRSAQTSAAGSWSVRYLPAEAALDRARTVDHPAQIAPTGPIRLWIELDVQPGGVWNPPFLDYVQLSWEEQDR